MQRLIYILLYPIIWLLSVMPLWVLHIKSSVLFVLAYYIIGYRRKVVKANIALALPEKSPEEQKKIAREFYRHLCDLIFESIKVLTISEKTMAKRFTYTNPELITRYQQKGQSMLIMCGHYGNWEWSGILGRQFDFKGYGVYKKLDNPYFDRLIKKLRGRFGAEVVPNTKIVPTLFRAKQREEFCISLILSDQTPRPGNFKHRDTFMDIDVPMFTGTEDLAKKLGFAPIFLKIVKVGRSRYQATLVPLAENAQNLPDYQITRLFYDQLEAQIRQAPSYYLWSHKRWKHRKA